MNSFRLLIFLISTICISHINAQINVNWIQQHYNTNFAKPKSLTTDQEGNIIMIGFYRGDVEMEIFEDNVPSNSNTVAFYLAKFKENGSFLWWKNIPLSNNATGLDVANAFVATDSQGNIYLTTTELNTKVVIIKYDPNGQIIWKKTSNQCWNSISGIEIDNKDNVYITGYFFNCPQLEFDDVIITRSNGDEYFLLKVDSEGNGIWGDRGFSYQKGRGLSLALTSDDQIIVAGEFLGNRFFLGSFDIPGSNVFNKETGFLAKYDNDGNVLWLSPYSNVNGSAEIETDTYGNIYVSAKNWLYLFNTEGGKIWSKNLGTTGPTYDHHLATDLYGNCYGCYSWGTDGINQNSIDIYCYKYTLPGDIAWSRRIGSERQDAIEDLLVTDTGDLISFCGYFNGNYFEIGDTTIIDSISEQTTFYGGFFQDCPNYTICIDSSTTIDNKVKLSVQIDGHDIRDFEIQWYSVENQTSLSNNSILEVDEIGEYTCVVTDSLGCGAIESLSVNLNSNADYLDKETNISLYPNPTSDLVTIRTDNGILKSVELINMSGAIIQSLNNIDSQVHTWSMEQYPQGKYFLKIQLQDSFVIKHLVKD